jgi:probable HAF family extracellular repeat protein
MSASSIRRQLTSIAIATLFVAGTASVSLSAHAGSVKFTILDLGTLGGTESFSDGFGTVNNSGQVVGMALTTNNTSGHAYRTAPNSAMTAASDLGTIGGPGSQAFSINSSGQVVGLSNPVGFPANHAFRTTANGKLTAANDLGTLGGTNSYGYGINDLGQTVGGSNVVGDVAFHAFRTTATGVITPGSDLGTLGGTDSFAYDINASGQTVGASNPTGTGNSFVFQHAFRTTATGVIDASTDLGTLGGIHSAAYGINDAGQVVGTASNGSGEHAFRTTATGGIDAASDLGSLGGSSSFAYGINNLGQTVGASEIANSRTMHAFFVDAIGGMQDLNNLIPSNSGWVLQEAHGINDLDQISGRGMIGGVRHAFLLTEVPSEVPLPSPGGAGLILLVTIGAVAYRGRRVVRAAERGRG